MPFSFLFLFGILFIRLFVDGDQQNMSNSLKVIIENMRHDGNVCERETDKTS
jgi:hypothetical protein